ncbi:MAG: DDE transposase family protein [Crocinitomicaceae bacterium]|nr:DDE transposase family protein [Crocinitomicaceae bacterium]|tara:strand:+ start:1554 stop:1994 length:441 start_codon:yes stop_codon:yes gene_type:complete
MNSSTERMSAAFKMWNEGVTQKEIARIFSVSEKTVGEWKKKGKWNANKAATFLSRDQQINFLYDQINEINTFIRDREEGQRFATSKEADALMKLTKSAKTLEGELGLSEVIDVGQDFLKFLKMLDYEAAQILHKYYDQYIQSKMPK